MSTDPGEGLRFFEITGTPFDAGAALGRIGAPAVHADLVKTRAWASVMALRDDPRLAVMLEMTEARYPRHVAELRGLAAGTGLSFEEIFAWNCRGDLWAMAPDGCTTVQIPGTRRVIAHNEDGLPVLRSHCAIVRFDSEGGIPFTSFAYPASLPGHTFAATDRGLVATVNNIRSRQCEPGVPRMVLTRALLDCASLDDAVAHLRSTPRAGAFHVSLARIGDPRLLSVEFTSATVSAREITAPAVHSNHLIHAGTAHEPQVVTESSGCRQERGDVLIGEQACDPLAILRDTGGPGLPIRRDDPDDPDDENTLATAVFELDDPVLAWRVYDRPSGPPRFHFRDRLAAEAGRQPS